MQWLRRSLSKLIPTPRPSPYFFTPPAQTPDEAMAAMATCPYWNGEKPLSKPNGVTMKVGDHVRTNARYAKEISRTPRVGVLLKPLTWTAGGWIVRLEGFEKPQYIHKRYMEVTDGR